MSLRSHGIGSNGYTAAARHPVVPALLDTVLAQIALPQAGVGWRHPRRRRIVDAIFALAPTDGAQAMLVAQIVSARLRAEALGRRAGEAGLPEERMRELRCSRDAAMRLAGRTARVLRRMQTRRGTEGDASAAARPGPSAPKNHASVPRAARGWPDQVRP
jgi:hypothetical protein